MLILDFGAGLLGFFGLGPASLGMLPFSGHSNDVDLMPFRRTPRTT